jgi:hypothetical protein
MSMWKRFMTMAACLAVVVALATMPALAGDNCCAKDKAACAAKEAKGECPAAKAASSEEQAKDCPAKSAKKDGCCAKDKQAKEGACCAKDAKAASSEKEQAKDKACCSKEKKQQ